MIDSPCAICNHREGYHAFTRNNGVEFCTECLIRGVEAKRLSDSKWIHAFKLDNLKLVEDLAKEKGLV